MKIPPLVIDPTVIADIKRVLEYAWANPVTTAMEARMLGNPEFAVGNIEAHVCIVPVGYRCVYSVDKQDYLYRHLSVSVLGDGVAPHPIAVEALMQGFGFTCGLNTAESIWKEDIGDKKVAINVAQKM